jgi:hypothetical protein
MTAQERDELMQFLRELSTSREPVDPAVRELVAQAVTQNPNVGYRLVQQVMGLRMALRAQTQAAPAPAAAEVAGSWGGSVLKVAVAAGLGAAAGTVLADQAASWLASSAEDADPGDWA